MIAVLTRRRNQDGVLSFIESKVQGLYSISQAKFSTSAQILNNLPR
jgi:hypothetical protein